MNSWNFDNITTSNAVGSKWAVGEVLGDRDPYGWAREWAERPNVEYVEPYITGRDSIQSIARAEAERIAIITTERIVRDIFKDFYEKVLSEKYEVDMDELNKFIGDYLNK